MQIISDEQNNPTLLICISAIEIKNKEISS